MVITVMSRVVMMMEAASVVIAATKLDIACEGIGKMVMVMGVIDPVHQRDVSLAGQHYRHRHAQHGDCTPQSTKLPPLQTETYLRQVFGELTTMAAPGNAPLTSAALAGIARGLCQNHRTGKSKVTPARISVSGWPSISACRRAKSTARLSITCHMAPPSNAVSSIQAGPVSSTPIAQRTQFDLDRTEIGDSRIS